MNTKTEGYYIPQSKTNSTSQYASFMQSQMIKEETRKKYTEFVGNTKTYLLSEAINNLLTKALDGGSIQFSSYGKALCEQFVKEEGYENLMKRFKTSTHLLAQTEKCVREAYDSIICKADKTNPLTFTIQDTEQIKFFDSLNGIPSEKVSKKINERVCDAAEEFIQRNINAKLDIEEIASKTKERIDNAKEKYDAEKAEKIQQEQMRMYKNEVDRIKARPVRNIYEHMINMASKCILESEELKNNYVNESGQFDLARVEDQVKVMYTFLEMVSSLKMKKVTNKYIEECISSIK